jgi:3-oxoacyl-[acyl-carrier protein] reductase
VDRLTAAKEDGASIEIDGKRVALGIPGGTPGAKVPTATGGDQHKAFSSIPLARPGTADEAASAMLLCVCCFISTR